MLDTNLLSRGSHRRRSIYVALHSTLGSRGSTSIRPPSSQRAPLVDVLCCSGIFSEHRVRVCTLRAAYVRAANRQDIAHGAPSVLKRYVTGVGGGTYFVLVLLYLRYPLSIYPSYDSRTYVYVRHPLCNRRAVSAITPGQLKTELAELRPR